jgi:hypothetical protein
VSALTDLLVLGSQPSLSISSQAFNVGENREEASITSVMVVVVMTDGGTAYL